MIGTFEAMKWGVFVSTSAENDGPSAPTVSNIAPWITIVGVDTLDHEFPADIHLGNGAVISGMLLYSGKGLNRERLVPLVYGRDATPEGNNNKSPSAMCTEGSLNPIVIKGNIELCEHVTRLYELDQW